MGWQVQETSRTCPWCKLFVTVVCVCVADALRGISGNKEVTLWTGRQE